MLTATVTDRVTEPNLDTCSAMAAPPTQWIRSSQSTLPVFFWPLTGPPSSDMRCSRPWQGTPRPHPGHQCHAPKPTNMRAANLPPRFGTVTAWDPTASLKQSRPLSAYWICTLEPYGPQACCSTHRWRQQGPSCLIASTHVGWPYSVLETPGSPPGSSSVSSCRAAALLPLTSTQGAHSC